MSGYVCPMHPYPMILQRRKIPADILAKIGEPTPRRGEPLTIPYYDLTPYGIEPLA